MKSLMSETLEQQAREAVEKNLLAAYKLARTFSIPNEGLAIFLSGYAQACAQEYRSQVNLMLGLREMNATM